MADIYSKSKRSELMSRVKQTRTAPEEKVAALLRDCKIRYRRNVKSLPGSPDFVIHSAKTVIFVHGCFWHGHPDCKLSRLPSSNRPYWEQKRKDNRSRDARKARQLRNKGWHIITIWQCRLKHPQRVRARLLRLLT